MKRFLKILALFLAPVILLLGMFSLALVRSGELTPTADIEAAALNGGLELFGLAYRDDTRALRRAVANAPRCGRCWWGTSRSMQLRGAFFASDSFTTQAAASYISQAQVFLENMPPDARPKHLLLVLDQYFYNETWTSIEPEDSAALRLYTQPDAFSALRRALGGLSGFVIFPCCMCWYAGRSVRHVGRRGGAGFYADGSYTYGTAVLHRKKAWTQSLRIRSAHRKNTNRFEYGETPDGESLAQTEALLAFCALAGIEVTAFLPPTPPLCGSACRRPGSTATFPPPSRRWRRCLPGTALRCSITPICRRRMTASMWTASTAPTVCTRRCARGWRRIRFCLAHSLTSPR